MQPPPYTGNPQQPTSNFILMNNDYPSKVTGGILKVIEIVLCFLVIICNNVDLLWQPLGGGWVNFVVIMAIFGSAFLYFVHVYDLPSKMVACATYRLGEMIYHIIVCVCWLISGIVAAARASELSGNPVHNSSSIAACAVFCFFAIVIYAVDTYFSYSAWRQGGHASDGTAPYNNFGEPSQGGANVGGFGPAPGTTAGPGASNVYSPHPEAGGSSSYSMGGGPTTYSEKPVY